jgi:hypothetical protein
MEIVESNYDLEFGGFWARIAVGHMLYMVSAKLKNENDCFYPEIVASTLNDKYFFHDNWEIISVLGIVKSQICLMDAAKRAGIKIS